jgi:aryl carrier-like protein
MHESGESILGEELLNVDYFSFSFLIFFTSRSIRCVTQLERVRPSSCAIAFARLFKSGSIRKFNILVLDMYVQSVDNDSGSYILIIT